VAPSKTEDGFINEKIMKVRCIYLTDVITVADEISEESNDFISIKRFLDNNKPEEKNKKKKRRGLSGLKSIESIASFSSFNIGGADGFLKGTKVPIDSIINRPIIITDFRIDKSKFPNKKTNQFGECLRLQFVYPKESEENVKILFTGSRILIDMIRKIDNDEDCEFPFIATIVREGNYYKFI